MKVAVTGASGLIGGTLVRALRMDGNEVVTATRGVPEVEGAHAVVHLAGAPIGVRWTAARKRAILESRVAGTRRLVEAMGKAARPPRVLVCASAVGFYGNRADEVLTEESGGGTDFLAGVASAWEQEARSAPARSVQLRFGVVLTPRGGALAKMLPAFRAGLGGRLSSGEQWMSWIGLHDLIRVIRFAIARDDLAGAVNAVAPNPVRNGEFTGTLARVLRRPAVVGVPAFALRALFGEMADATLLASQRVVPERLERAGFTFDHPALEASLRHELSRGSR